VRKCESWAMNLETGDVETLSLTRTLAAIGRDVHRADKGRCTFELVLVCVESAHADAVDGRSM
jgi:hypothetical protein